MVVLLYQVHWLGIHYSSIATRMYWAGLWGTVGLVVSAAAVQAVVEKVDSRTIYQYGIDSGYVDRNP